LGRQPPSAGLPLRSAWHIVGGVETTVNPVARDFILFCIHRQGNQWPALYDEMCWVAGRRLFRGLGHDELRKVGIFFGLGGLKDTIRIVDAVAGQRREVSPQ